jgi:hypothetical protein
VLSFAERFLKEILSVGGGLMSVAGLVLGVVLWKVAPTTHVSLFSVLAVALPIGIGLVTLLIAFCLSTIHILKEIGGLDSANRVLPRVVRVEKTDNSILLLLESSSLFNTGLGVTLYVVKEKGFEASFGIGRVINVQENGMIQVEVSGFQPKNDLFVEKITKNDTKSLKQVLVKPHVMYDDVHTLMRPVEDALDAPIEMEGKAS